MVHITTNDTVEAASTPHEAVESKLVIGITKTGKHGLNYRVISQAPDITSNSTAILYYFAMNGVTIISDEFPYLETHDLNKIVVHIRGYDSNDDALISAMDFRDSLERDLAYNRIVTAFKLFALDNFKYTSKEEPVVGEKIFSF